MGTAILLISLASSTCLIFLNKYLISTYDFKWITFLSSFHFSLTFIFLEILNFLNIIIRDRSITKSKIWLTGLLNMLSVVFMNLSLRFNSIEFYQLSKSFTIPLSVIINLIFYRKKIQLRTLSSVLLVVSGICIFAFNDVQINEKGLLFAVIASLFSTLSRMQIEKIVKESSPDGLSILHAIIFPQASLSFIASIITEMRGDDSVLVHAFTMLESIICIITAFIAVIANISSFSLIGDSASFGSQILGNIKTLFIILFGISLFQPNVHVPHEMIVRKLGGIILCMIGIIINISFDAIDAHKSTMDSFDDQFGIEPEHEDIPEEKELKKEKAVVRKLIHDPLSSSDSVEPVYNLE
jgi:solute carrier family 35 protein E3